jgi:hypothetical protein
MLTGFNSGGGGTLTAAHSSMTLSACTAGMTKPVSAATTPALLFNHHFVR